MFITERGLGPITQSLWEDERNISSISPGLQILYSQLLSRLSGGGWIGLLLLALTPPMLPSSACIVSANYLPAISVHFMGWELTKNGLEEAVMYSHCDPAVYTLYTLYTLYTVYTDYNVQSVQGTHHTSALWQRARGLCVCVNSLCKPLCSLIKLSGGTVQHSLCML